MTYHRYAGALKIVTASTEEPVTLPEAKLWLRLDEFSVDEDDLINGLISRARLFWEDVTNRSALVQTFDYYLDEQPKDSCPIELPKAPLVAVTSIKGYALTENSDSGGTAMSTSGYYVDTAHEFGRVMPLSAYYYPVATRSINPVTVRFTAGYSTSTTGVPDTVKAEIKGLVAQLYEHRGDEGAQASALNAYRSELDLPTWG